ncbi:MAG: hypothetical protein GTO53_04475 [Planctomycetales bacterium]|nr:hypothetical protein [Planctomycetales bacterium]NIM08412.1 hypothetical protein [Planctomycetales bacterium]NIN07887.1 hypothetical protein [Planctomycetales bacterium]NIN77017.1 hypothetical protein [Planctomycetales bacterium]NIO34200.1 hypothetical protein [Planctomycetales bacterium]
MTVPITATEVLDREFLQVRARLLEIAAALDRIDRASGDVAEDARIKNIRQALQRLDESGQGRAEQLQLIFSRPFDENWQAELGIELG